jgi:uncharacterized membrane protein YkvA (DUF1232 family)
MKKILSTKRISKAFNNARRKAELLISEDGKVEELLQKSEAKLKTVPKLGNELGSVPLLMSLLRSYIAREYRAIPKTSIISVAGALLYFISPLDIIPDALPMVGYLDDMAIIAFCLNSLSSDLEAFRVWRKERGREHVEIPDVDGPDIFDAAKGIITHKIKK